jgi:predicted phosphodiesterase
VKLAILSDVHLEFDGCLLWREDFASADVVVLAGDIGPGLRGVEWADNALHGVAGCKEIVYVPGNHEYYGHDFTALRSDLINFDPDHAGHVNVLDRGEWRIRTKSGEYVRFLGATLWTDYELENEPYDVDASMEMARGMMRDHAVIRNGDRLFTPADAKRQHEESVKWLEKLLSEPFEGKTVVVSHHLPLPDSISARYAVNALNPAFASDLSGIFSRHSGQIDLWVHGHTHTACDYLAGNARVICNPRGYPGETPGQYRPKIVEI